MNTQHNSLQRAAPSKQVRGGLLYAKILWGIRVLGLYIAAQLVLATVYAQNEAQTAVRLMASARGDSVVLRWTPLNPALWKKMARSGYRLERYRTDLADTTRSGKGRRLNKEVLKAAAEPEWKQVMAADSSPLIRLAYDALYAPEFNLPLENERYFPLLEAAGEMQLRHAMAILAADADERIANLQGLRFVDKTIKKGKEYIYRLYLSPEESTQDSLYTYCVVKTNAPTALPESPPAVVKVEPDNGKVLIRWKHSTAFVGYYIERGSDGVHFRKMNRLPLAPVVEGDRILDSLTLIDPAPLPINYYRVVAHNAFAERALPAKAVRLKYEAPPEAAIPKLTGYKVVGGKKVWLEWQTSAPFTQIRGFQIVRGRSAVDSFTVLNTKLLPALSRTFADETPPLATERLYYCVVAIDTAGRMLRSIPLAVTLRDTTPPPRPPAPNLQTTPNGKLMLRWELQELADVKEVYLYMTLHAERSKRLVAVFPAYVDSFIEPNPIAGAGYCLQAVDRQGNASGVSDVTYYQKKQPPSTAPIPNLSAESPSMGIALLRWEALPVKAYRLYRAEGEGPRQLLVTLPAKTLSYRDSVKHATTTYYLTAVVDAQGTESAFSAPVTVQPAKQVQEAKNAPAPPRLSGERCESGKCIRLKWEGVSTGSKVLVYRAYLNGRFGLYQALPATDALFTDTDLLLGGEYSYRIKVMDAAGHTSAPSNTVTLKYKP